MNSNKQPQPALDPVGIPVSEIAKQLGCRKSVLLDWLEEYGYTFHSDDPVLDESLAERIIEDLW